MGVFSSSRSFFRANNNSDDDNNIRDFQVSDNNNDYPTGNLSNVSSAVVASTYYSMEHQEQQQQQRKAPKNPPVLTEMAYDQLCELTGFDVVEKKIHLQHRKLANNYGALAPVETVQTEAQSKINQSYMYTKFFHPYVLNQAANENGQVTISIVISDVENNYNIVERMLLWAFEPPCGYVHMGLLIGGV